MTVPRPSRFCLGGDFILGVERLVILYHAACSRADESRHTHSSKRSLGGAPAFRPRKLGKPARALAAAD
jgi:hypothetical protein